MFGVSLSLLLRKNEVVFAMETLPGLYPIPPLSRLKVERGLSAVLEEIGTPWTNRAFDYATYK